MDAPSAQLRLDLRDAVIRELAQRRPLLHHLNPDTSWFLQVPRPLAATKHGGRVYFNVLIDPWLSGGQSDVAKWFSQQWHAQESKVKNVAEVEELAREIEILAAPEGLRLGKGRQRNGLSNVGDIETFIDAVAISHEFTDHCHKETLLEIHPNVPVFATKKAAALISSWSHFRLVQEIPACTGQRADWRSTSLYPLPEWLGTSRLVSEKDALYYHSALLIAFNSNAGNPALNTGNSDGDEVAEAVIYTPHGINNEDLRIVPSASPPLHTLAFLHGLHDISIGRQQQLNLGAHNGLKAQRLLQAKYWISTHDEIKKGGGLVNWFLRRNALTLSEALEEERKRDGGVLRDESELVAMRDVHFAELMNGENNFTFSHSQDNIHKRAYSLTTRSKPNPRRNFSFANRPRNASTSKLPKAHRRKSAASFFSTMTNEYKPPPGPPPSWTNRQSAAGAARPPPGPPPGHRLQEHVTFAPSPQRQGNSSSEIYAPPPGPPPSYAHDFAPPQGPPPSKIQGFQNQSQASQFQDPPPNDAWKQVPDTSLLPPPPSLGHDVSPTANASLSDADRAHDWCRANPLYAPHPLTRAEHAALQAGQPSLLAPPSFAGTLVPQNVPSTYRARTRSDCTDTCLLTSLPLYSALIDSPLLTRRPKTIYFELRVLRMGGSASSANPDEADAGIAIGFLAPPYPAWRLPGWERSSLGIHGDDGRRYVADTWGGKDFTTSFKPGETVGVGMTFSPPDAPPGYGQGNTATDRHGARMAVDVFFTRRGRVEAGWDLHEERDAAGEGVEGLEGDADLMAAVGVFGACEFEVVFAERDWLWKRGAR